MNYMARSIRVTCVVLSCGYAIVTTPLLGINSSQNCILAPYIILGFEELVELFFGRVGSFASDLADGLANLQVPYGTTILETIGK